MSEKELREQIGHLIWQDDWKSVGKGVRPWEEVDIEVREGYSVLADSLLELAKEAGWGQQDMLNAGFRKVSNMGIDESGGQEKMKSNAEQTTRNMTIRKRLKVESVSAVARSFGLSRQRIMEIRDNTVCRPIPSPVAKSQEEYLATGGVETMAEEMINRATAGFEALPKDADPFWKGYWQGIADHGQVLKARYLGKE